MPSQNKKPLRQVAAEKLNGPNTNPSQLGDPISLKSETNQDSPDNVEYDPEGAEVSPSKKNKSSSSSSKSDHSRTNAYGVSRNDPTTASSNGGNEKKGFRYGPKTDSGKRNPLEGDATSMEREQVVSDGRGVREEEENGPVGRGRGRGSSKL